MKTKSIRKLYSAILLVGLCLSVLTPRLNAQRGPQDNWYLDKEVPLPEMPGLNKPRNIFIDGSGIIYLVETGNDRVQVLDGNGSLIRFVGSVGSELGQFNNPSGITVDVNGTIYVADTGNHRIQVFDENGTFVRSFGSQGSSNLQFNSPITHRPTWNSTEPSWTKTNLRERSWEPSR